MGNFHEGPDGNLKAEYDLSSTIMRAVTDQQTNDMYSCMLIGETYTPLYSIDSITDSYEYVVPHRMLQCLDLATVATLNGLPPMVAAPGQRRSVANISMEFTAAEAEGVSNNTHLFGGVDCGLDMNDALYGESNATKIGDGVINGYDVAVLLWSQFGKPPYDRLGVPSGFQDVETIQPHVNIADTCCTVVGLDGWSCINSTALSKGEYLSVTNPYNNICPAPQIVDYTEEQVWGRRLEQERELQLVDESVDFLDMASQAAAGVASAQEIIGVHNWAEIPGVGKWTKLDLPSTAIALELSLLNIDPATASPKLSFKAPPEYGCDQPIECEPDVADKSKTVIHFHRNEEVIMEAGFTMRDCALIFPSRDTALSADGTIGMYQEPPSAACPFDIFIWTPAGVSLDENAPCNGNVGVEMGSSMNDGRGGLVVRDLVCETAIPSPPPPPMAASPPSPGAEPQDISLSVSFNALLAPTAVWDAQKQASYVTRVAQALGVTSSLIEVVCDGPGCEVRRARALQAEQTSITTTVYLVGAGSIAQAASVATTMNTLRTDFAAMEALFGVPVMVLSQPGIARPQSTTTSSSASASSDSASTFAGSLNSIVSGISIATSAEEDPLVALAVAGAAASLIICAAIALRAFVRRQRGVSGKVLPAPEPVWNHGSSVPKPLMRNHAVNYQKYLAPISRPSMDGRQDYLDA